MGNVDVPAYKREKKNVNYITKKDAVMPKIAIDDVAVGMIAFLISRVTVADNITPFGTAFVASGCKDKKKIFALIGACIGTLTVHQDIIALKYLFTFIAFCVSKLFLKKENVYINAVCIAVSLFLSGFFVSLASYMLTYDLLLLTLECVISGFFSIAFKSCSDYMNEKRYFSYITNEQLLSITFVCSLSLCGLGNTVTVGYFNLCAVLCSVIVMILAQNRGAAFGACAGVAAGLVCALGKTNVMDTVGIFALCGFSGGCVRSLGKGGVCAAFLLSGSATFFLTKENVFDSTNVLNMILGAGIFMILPAKLCEKIKMFTDGILIETDKTSYISKSKEYIENRLNELCKSYSRLSEAVAHTNENNFSNSSTANALNAVKVKVCEKCGLKNICWEKEKKETINVLKNSKFSEKGSASKEDFPLEFKNKCVNFHELLNCLNHYYSLNHANELWQNRLKESQNLMSEQYKEFSEMLETLNVEFFLELSGHTEYEQKTEIQILNELTKFELSPTNVCVREIERGYFRAEIFFATNDYMTQKNDVVKLVSEILQTNMNVVDVKINSSEKKLVLEPIYRFMPLCASVSAKKDKNEENGDYIIKENLSNNRFFISVSDGMGSGNEAAYCSKKTAEILKELLRAKYSAQKAVKIVNSVLASSGNEVFSTIDAVVFDLLTGEAHFIKSGAMPSIIINQGGAECVFCANMPVGILNQTQTKIISKKLKKDDILIMFSDGVSDFSRGYDWITKTAYEMRDKNPDEICEILIKDAIIQNHGKISDDMSFVVFKLTENF